MLTFSRMLCSGCCSRAPLADRHRRHWHLRCVRHQHRQQLRHHSDARVTETWQTLVFEPFSHLVSRRSPDSRGLRSCCCLWSKRTPHTTQGTAPHRIPALTAHENEPFLCFRRPRANDKKRTLQRLLTCADGAGVCSRVS